MDHLLTIWSIRISIICLFAFLISRSLGEAKSQIPIRYVVIWGVGAGFSFLHLVFAMGWIHGWSHVAALEETAVQTEELLGVRVGIGIYFNYVFVFAWLVDAVWMLMWRPGYLRRPGWATIIIYGYLVFIAINGAVIFEAGIIRWITILLMMVWLSVVTVRKSSKSR